MELALPTFESLEHNELAPCSFCRLPLQDLPDELTFKCFLRELLAFDPVCAGNGGTVQIRVVGCLALEEGCKVVELGDGVGIRARSALTSMPSGTWSPCCLVLSLMGPGAI